MFFSMVNVFFYIVNVFFYIVNVFFHTINGFFHDDIFVIVQPYYIFTVNIYKYISFFFYAEKKKQKYILKIKQLKIGKEFLKKWYPQ